MNKYQPRHFYENNTLFQFIVVPFAVVALMFLAVIFMVGLIFALGSLAIGLMIA